jgi:hypothetical protein
MILRSSSLTTNLTIRIFMAIQAATAIILWCHFGDPSTGWWYICHHHTSTKFTSSFSTNMSVVSNDPALWPDVNSYRVSSYFVGSWEAVGCWSWGLNLTLIAVRSRLLCWSDIWLGWAW